MIDKPDPGTDDPRPLAEIEIQKNNRGDVLRLTIEQFRGHPLIAARVWFQTKDGEFRPSRQGFGINPRLIFEVIEGLQSLAEHARAIGWLPEEDAPGRACETCDTPITSARADARYCSPRCRAKASRTKSHEKSTEAHGPGSDPNDAFDR